MKCVPSRLLIVFSSDELNESVKATRRGHYFSRSSVLLFVKTLFVKTLFVKTMSTAGVVSGSLLEQGATIPGVAGRKAAGLSEP